MNEWYRTKEQDFGDVDRKLQQGVWVLAKVVELVSICFNKLHPVEATGIDAARAIDNKIKYNNTTGKEYKTKRVNHERFLLKPKGPPAANLGTKTIGLKLHSNVFLFSLSAMSTSLVIGPSSKFELTSFLSSRMFCGYMFRLLSRLARWLCTNT